MRLILPLLLLVAPVGAAHAQCTQADAVSKMQTILASPQYRQAVSQTGTYEAPDASRTVTKAGIAPPEFSSLHSRGEALRDPALDPDRVR
ncbi:MAG: hypothetical protein B7Y90_10260 [Alphaproteobacteria bacterium 32-64-14]|nr:MAG: hypothetical protein B7Y90_10260 [Alphaproteobacteria bacterium 32-64-14]